MTKEDILIRLLKAGHISDDEFKLLYGDPIPIHNWDWIPKPDHPLIWHGINDPSTGEPIGPTYSTS